MADSTWERETRQERRDRKRTAERSRIPKHGRNIAMHYRNAIAKRIAGRNKGKQKPDA